MNETTNTKCNLVDGDKVDLFVKVVSSVYYNRELFGVDADGHVYSWKLPKMKPQWSMTMKDETTQAAVETLMGVLRKSFVRDYTAKSENTRYLHIRGRVKRSLTAWIGADHLSGKQLTYTKVCGVYKLNDDLSKIVRDTEFEKQLTKNKPAFMKLAK